MLRFIPPMLPTLVETPPAAGEWTHEIKFDGYRTQLIIQAGKVLAFTRNGHDWAAKYPGIVAASLALGVDNAIIDGEVILNDAEGKPDFGRLRSAIASKGKTPLVFMAFDLLHLHTHDLRRMELAERRHILEDLTEPGHVPIRFSQTIDGSAAKVFAAIERMGLKGMVSKRPDSPYVSGRTGNWLKIKCYDEAEFEIVGVQRERGKPAMALMVTRDAERRYMGSAFITLPKGIRERLWARVTAKAGAPAPKGLAKEKAEWIKPGLVATVRYLKGEEKLRHATLKDVREEY